VNAPRPAAASIDEEGRTPRRHEYDHHFSVRVTAAELRQLRARAADAGLSLARYAIEALGAVDE